MIVRSIRSEVRAAAITAYWVTLDDVSRELPVVVDETSGIRVIQRDELAAEIGRGPAAMVARLIVRKHDGESVILPQEIDG